MQSSIHIHGMQLLWYNNTFMRLLIKSQFTADVFTQFMNSVEGQDLQLDWERTEMIKLIQSVQA